MSVYSQVNEWAKPLRALTVGVSITALILVPPTSSNTLLVKQKPLQEQVQIIATIPDGRLDQRAFYYTSSQGLSTSLELFSPPQLEEKIEVGNIAQELHDISGLPVKTLTSLLGVSPMAYYKWLSGGGITSEHNSRINELLDVFHTLRSLRGSNIRAFLETEGSAGKPLNLLANGDSSAVIGLALRPSAKPDVSSTLSVEARSISGLKGWLHPARKLNWQTSHLIGDEQDDALDRLSPKPLTDEIDVFGGVDEAN